MKRHLIIVMAILLASFCVFEDSSKAQKRRSGSTRRTAKPTPTPSMDMRPEANKVAEQIKNVTKFLYIYGKIANGLEIAEDQAKRGQTNQTIAAQNKQNKDALVANINGLRTGLDTVVKSFQSSPRLQVQFLKISYAAESLATAEQLATAGRFDEAGKALVTAVERLTDTVTSMKLQ